MQKSKFIGLLKGLSEEELKRFNEYIHSPFFKKSANAIALFEWIYAVQDHPHYQSYQLDNSVVLKGLFSKQQNVDLKQNSLNVALSELVKLFQHFLAMLEIDKQEDYVNSMTAKNLQNRRMDKDFWQVFRKTIVKQKKSKRSIQYYYQQYLLEEIVYNFQPVDKQLQREKRKHNIDIHGVLKTFEVYTILNRLRYCCFNWNSANIIIEEKNINLAQDLVVTIKVKALDRIILINFYYLSLLLLMKDKDEKHFFKLKLLLKNNKTPIGKEELLNIYTIASNYCQEKASNGKAYFYEEMFDLYRLMLEQRLIYKGKFIKKNYIKNIVSLGLQLGKIKWVSQFIEKVKNETLPKYRRSVYAFNKGIFYFYTHQYREAQQVLSQVENIDVFYDLDYRSLLLKCYYELNETETLFSLVGAFKRFVKQQKIAASSKKSYVNFIKYTLRAYKIKINPRKSESKMKELEKSILENSPINNQRWLLEKVRE